MLTDLIGRTAQGWGLAVGAQAMGCMEENAGVLVGGVGCPGPSSFPTPTPTQVHQRTWPSLPPLNLWLTYLSWLLWEV